MPQIFTRATNVIAWASLFGVVLLLAVITWMALVYARSSYGTGMGVIHEQPVAFSHEHHVGVLGIECRYCHTTVEYSSFAGIPPTKTCMNCHSQIWVGSAPLLEPVRASYRSGQSIAWKRVYNLPGFVYFDHSIHVQKGIGCTSCHGRVDRMPLMYQVPSLLMEWCLECHRNLAQHIRPREAVFKVDYEPPPDQLALGQKLVRDYQIRSPDQLTSCSLCHR